MEMYILIFAIFLLLVFLFRSSVNRGRYGEYLVANEIGSLDQDKYISFHGIALQTPDGSTQIDHVLISQYGIFVIETKNLTGWIFGSVNQKKWTQTLKYGYKYQFQNPLRQNYKHTKALQNYLSVNKDYIISVVVFVGDSEFMTEMPDNVLTLKELSYFIESYSDEILSSHEVAQYSNKLRILEEAPLIDNQKHIENVYKNKNNPICPKCGVPMVIRTVTKGSNVGEEFWGCSRFPSCRITKEVY